MRWFLKHEVHKWSLKKFSVLTTTANCERIYLIQKCWVHCTFNFSEFTREEQLIPLNVTNTTVIVQFCCCQISIWFCFVPLAICSGIRKFAIDFVVVIFFIFFCYVQRVRNREGNLGPNFLLIKIMLKDFVKDF